MEPLANRQSNATPQGAGPAAKSAGFKGLLAAQIESDKENKKKTEPGYSAESECSKKIEVVSDEGVVKVIRVRCSCGEVTEIECEYSE
ncbi:MAG: hypothetical protein ACLFS1_03915 [Opitutales bacterium]